MSKKVLSDHEIEMMFMLRYGSIDKALEKWRDSHVALLKMRGWSDEENEYLFKYLQHTLAQKALKVGEIS